MPETLYIPATGGVQLAATSFGALESPVVLLMHGAGQTRHSWRGAGERLAQTGWRAVSVDARGHGDSDWPEDGDYAIDTLVADLRSVVRHFADNCGQKPVLVGASLGGICGMLAEGESGDEVFHSMVLVDITPRIDNTGVARIIDFMCRHQDGFASLEEAVKAVAAYQSHRRDSAGAAANKGAEENGKRQSNAEKNGAGLKKNLRLADDGRYYWHWDPRLMQHIGTIDEAFYQRQRLAAGQLKLPVMLIRGQQSEIVSHASVEEFLELVPHAEYVDIADAAHMVAGDHNDAFASSVIEFINA